MADLILPDTAHANDPEHIEDHNKIVTAISTVNTAVEAVETELGTNPSGTYSTVSERLDDAASSPIYRYLYSAAGSPVFADEFTADDGQWTVVYPTGKQANVTWSISRHTLLANHTAVTDGTAAFHGFLRPMPRALQVGDAIQTAYSNIGMWGDYTMTGVGFSTGTVWGTSNCVHAQMYDDDNNYRVQGSNGMNGDTVGGNGTSVSLWAPFPMHIRLVYTGTNTWRNDRSYDGVNWSLGNTSTYTLGTATHMGIFIGNWSSAKPAYVHYEYLRMYEGVI